MAKRDARLLAIVNEVGAARSERGVLPEDPAEQARVIDAEVRARVRWSGRCNVSPAVSDLVPAGLARRHYQVIRIDHHNRGAQREGFYALTVAAAWALGGRA